MLIYALRGAAAYHGTITNSPLVNDVGREGASLIALAWMTTFWTTVLTGVA